MTVLTKRMPLIYAATPDAASWRFWSSPELLQGATGMLLVAVRRLNRPASAIIGAHLMSPSWVNASFLEVRVLEVLEESGFEMPFASRIAATTPLPAGLAAHSLPIVALTLDVSLGAERLAKLGVALARLREEGVVLLAHDSEAPADGPDLVSTVSVLMAAADGDDRVAQLSSRAGSSGFVVAPEVSDHVRDGGDELWLEPAGEVPHATIELRPFLRLKEVGDNQPVRKKAPAIYITRYDKTRLLDLLRGLDAAPQSNADVQDLERELERGTEVESTEVEADVVTMNSTVRITDLDAGTTHVYTIVFPADADLDRGRISILSPLGTALLGYRAGDTVTWEMPEGTRRFRVDELVYQPEAAGDFHL